MEENLLCIKTFYFNKKPCLERGYQILFLLKLLPLKKWQPNHGV